MDIGIVEVVAQYGVMGSLLFAVMYWLVKYYLPGHERQHREQLESILRSHDQDITRLITAVERNTSVVQFISQALLMQSLVRGGINRDEAEQIAESIRLTTLSAVDRGGADHPGNTYR